METDFFTTYAISAAFGIGLLSVVLSALSLYYKDEKVPDRVKKWLRKVVPTMTLMGLLAIVLVVTDYFFRVAVR